MKVLLYTGVRNESRIEEWVIHHRMLGFDHIGVIDHCSEVPLEPILRKFDFVTVKRSDNRGAKQMEFYNIALKEAQQQDYDWLLFIDGDEFVVLNQHETVQEFLQGYEDVDMIGMNWLMIGSNHLDTDDPSKLMFEAYTRSCPKLDHHIKSWVRPKSGHRSTHPHYWDLIPNKKFQEVHGHTIHPPGPFYNNTAMAPADAKAFIAHYIYQSFETYTIRKVKSPRVSTGGYRAVFYDKEFIHTQYNDVENFLVRDRYADRLRAEMAKYEIVYPRLEYATSSDASSSSSSSSSVASSSSSSDTTSSSEPSSSTSTSVTSGEAAVASSSQSSSSSSV